MSFHYLILSAHIALCVVLVILVLLQQGKGADMGATLGGGSNTLFGASGATSLIIRTTTGVAVAFMITSILLVRSYLNGGGASPVTMNLVEGSVMGGEQAAPEAVNVEAEKAAPAPANAPAAQQQPNPETKP